jgi:aerobic-type carbon monoxide dehydrogenase small subunit (CoxS/CutS family)
MLKKVTLHVNGVARSPAVDPETPLLYVLRNDLDQKGPRFGCGLAQCGACSVHIEGQIARSCSVPVGAIAGKRVTTLDGLAATYRRAHKIADATTLHPVQQAFIDEQAAQCGYCMNGWIMTAAALLAQNPKASDAQIRDGLSGLKCRCGTQVSVLKAVKKAAVQMAREAT